MAPGIPEPWAENERVRLTELWLTAIEETTEVMLARGEHAEAAARLAKLVRDYPLREKFAGQLMLAQYRCGRQADALAVFEASLFGLKNALYARTRAAGPARRSRRTAWPPRRRPSPAASYGERPGQHSDDRALHAEDRARSNRAALAELRPIPSTPPDQANGPHVRQTHQYGVCFRLTISMFRY